MENTTQPTLQEKKDKAIELMKQLGIVGIILWAQFVITCLRDFLPIRCGKCGTSFAEVNGKKIA